MANYGEIKQIHIIVHIVNVRLIIAAVVPHIIKFTNNDLII